MYMANNSSILQYCRGMLIEGVLVFYRTTEYATLWEGGGGGGLNCEAKAQVLVVTPPPPPLFFLKVGCKKGGHNSGAVRYVYSHGQVYVMHACTWSKALRLKVA